MNDKIWIHSNRFKDNEKTIQYFNVKEPKNIYKKTINTADFILDNLVAGTWCIYYTTKQYFNLKRQSPTEYLNDIRSILSLSDKQYDLPFSYLRNVIENNADEEPLALLYDYRTDILNTVSSSRRDKLNRAVIFTLDMMQYINNKKMDTIDVYDTFLFDNSVYNRKITGEFTGYVTIYKRNNKSWNLLLRKYYLNKEIDLSSYPEGLYKIDLYDENMDLLKRYYSVVFSDKEIQTYYNPYRLQKIADTKRINQLLEDTIYAPDLSDGEKQIYTRQLLYSPNNLYFNEPIITEDDYSRIHVDFNYDGIAALKEPVYLVAEEQDTLNRTDSDFYKRRFIINDKSLVIDTKENYFNDETYYFYIEDNNNKKLSFISAYNIPLQDDDDYQERYRKQLLTNRVQRITTQLNYDLLDEVARNAVLTLDSTTYDTDTTLYNLIDKAFSVYYQDKYATNCFDVLRSFYTDKAYHEDMDSSSLPDVKVRPQWHIVEFPYTLPSNYIVERTAFTRTGYTKQYFRNTDTALSIYYYPEDYVVFSVFSLDTGLRIGGFLMIDNTKDTLRYNTYRLKAVTDYE